MTTSRLLLPLRFPELGPALGKLVTGTGRVPGGFVLESHRVQLVNKIIERAGEARRLAAHDDRGAAIAALGRDAWLAAWEETVSGIGVTMLASVEERLGLEAEAARMPHRTRDRLVLTDSDRRAVAARLGASGARLVPALDRLHELGRQALEATPAQREAMEAWQESLRTAARRLEEAWLALEDAVEAESTRWHRVAEAVAAWRRPMWPVVVVTAGSVALATWLGLMLGGYTEIPAWLLPVLSRLSF